MAQLRQDFEKFEALSTKIVVVGPERVSKFKKFWAQYSLPFIGISDLFQSVLRLFGQEVRIFQYGRMPAQVIIDKAGVVRYAHYGDSMSDIPENVRSGQHRL